MNNEIIDVKIELLDPELKLPTFAYPGDVAFDLQSRISTKVMINDITGIPTGIKIELPIRYEALIRPRSGLALKRGITVFNSPGSIDSEYRGEIIAIIANFSKSDFIINKGDRICQMAIRPVPQINLIQVDKVRPTIRDGKGFGSSGV